MKIDLNFEDLDMEQLLRVLSELTTAMNKKISIDTIEPKKKKHKPYKKRKRGRPKKEEQINFKRQRGSIPEGVQIESAED